MNYGFYDRLNDEKFIKKKYELIFGKPLDLDNPITFNEKLQWLKLHDRNPMYSLLVDKYRVKEFVSNVLGPDYIIPTLGVWKNAEDIDFNDLPNRFVLKCNHNSGLGMYICKDKTLLVDNDFSNIIKGLNKGLSENFYLKGREWPYKNVERLIIAEQYMEDSKTNELRDYKFFCFNGKVRFFKVDFNRFIEHRANYYDLAGNLIDICEDICPPNKDVIIDMPKSLDKMVKYAETLAKGIPFVRVDFYDVNDHIYFGEMTFFPASGFGHFSPCEWDEKIGEMLAIPAEMLIGFGGDFT